MTPLDLDDIESRIKDGIEDLDGPSYSGIADDAFSALAEIIAEVARLRGEAAQEREAERAAIVAWLREQRAYGTDELLGHGFANVCGILADAIESGEHRREGGE